MELWNSFWSALTTLIPNSGLWAVAAIVLLRSAAVPIPIPADLLVVMVGVQAREQQLPMWQAWLLLAGATTVGAGILYGFVRWVGQGEIARHGRYLGLSSQRLSSAELKLGEGGARAVLVARIVPGLRLAIVAVCAMLRFRWWNFVAAVLLGALIYVAACLAVGYIIGPAISGLVGVVAFPLGLLEPILGLGVLLFWVSRARRRLTAPSVDEVTRSKRARAGALAGALAISGATMLVNILIYLAVPAIMLFGSGSYDVNRIVSFAGGVGSILGSFLGTILVGIAWGVAYGVANPRWGPGWSDWQHGLSFAVLPLALVVIALAFATAQRGLPPLAGALLTVGEATLLGAYGVLLGLIYPVLRVRGLPPTTEHAPTRATKVRVESPVQ
jgi:membrane protein DedA with SNARE-associated domain